MVSDAWERSMRAWMGERGRKVLASARTSFPSQIWGSNNVFERSQWVQRIPKSKVHLMASVKVQETEEEAQKSEKGENARKVTVLKVL